CPEWSRESVGTDYHSRRALFFGRRPVLSGAPHGCPSGRVEISYFRKQKRSLHRQTIQKQSCKPMISSSAKPSSVILSTPNISLPRSRRNVAPRGGAKRDWKRASVGRKKICTGRDKSHLFTDVRVRSCQISRGSLYVLYCNQFLA